MNQSRLMGRHWGHLWLVWWIWCRKKYYPRGYQPIISTFVNPVTITGVICPPCSGNRDDSNRVDKNNVYGVTKWHSTNILSHRHKFCWENLHFKPLRRYFQPTTDFFHSPDWWQRGLPKWKHAYVPSMKEHCLAHRGCSKLPFNMAQGPTHKRHLVILISQLHIRSTGGIIILTTGVTHYLWDKHIKQYCAKMNIL